MATLGSPTRSPRTRKTFARKCERICCNTLTYFPLVFVYGLTTWAVWVCVHIGLTPSKAHAWTGRGSNFLAVSLYIMLNWSYTTSVFTNPGSSTDSRSGYSALPTSEQPTFSQFTVKSSGEIRFCKKCQAKKPDRAHHCSTCKRCVLKMDHHCPWLATCVGLHNYKAFLLFLIYTSLFCWAAFAISATWTVSTIFNEKEYIESYLPVNFIMLAVLSGIIGLVLTGFTGWHIYLTLRGYTTIEKLEKTRYLSPVKRTLQYHPQDRHYISPERPSLSNQLHEIHANALPGVLRPEEGESRSPSPSHSHSNPGISINTSTSPAHQSLLRSYADLESARDHDRYDNYLDELASDSLPHAFDLGIRKNTLHIFGPRPLLWALPLRTTTGDGWHWEPSPKWLMARERIKKEREAQHRAQKERERAAGWGVESPGEAPWIPKPGWRGYGNAEADQEPDGRYLTTSNGVSAVRGGRRSPGKADSILGRWPGSSIDDGHDTRHFDGNGGTDSNSFRDQGEGTPLRTLDRRRMRRPPTDEELLRDDDDDVDDYDTSSDEQNYPFSSRADREHTFERITSQNTQTQTQTQNWNDIPDGVLDSQRSSKARTTRTKTLEKGQKGAQGKEWDAWSPR